MISMFANIYPKAFERKILKFGIGLAISKDNGNILPTASDS